MQDEIEMWAAAVAADVAATLGERAGWGLELVPGDGRSKLGGRPDLPDAWPLNDGHGLTHLASIALAELPAFEGRDLLPAGGTLVFFADFHPDTEGHTHQVIHIPEGAETRPAEPPVEVRHERVVPVELPERRIAFAPCLSLPFPEDLWEADEAAFDRLTAEPGYAQHLILGHPIFIQGEDPGGQVTFHGAAEDLRAGRWDCIQALFESS